MIKAVIFDLDDTLYAYEPLDKKARKNVEIFTCKTLGISEKQYKEAYQFGRERTKAGLPDTGAGHNRLLYCQKTLEYLGVLPMPLSLQMYEQYWGTFLQEMKLFSGVRELFELLKEKRIPIVICTDLTAHIQHRKIEALGIAPFITYLVSSEEAGKEKPAPEMFALCLEKLKLPAEEVWYVGDSFHKDVEGALRAGMKAVWFHRQTEELAAESGFIEKDNVCERENIQMKPYIEVKDYTELKEKIKRETSSDMED